MDQTQLLLVILIAVTAVGFLLCLRDLRATQRSVDTLEQTLRREITRAAESQERRLLKIANKLEVRPSITPPEVKPAEAKPEQEDEPAEPEKKAEEPAPEKVAEPARAALPSANVEEDEPHSEDETRLLAKPAAARVAAPEKKAEEPAPGKKAEPEKKAEAVDTTGIALAKLAGVVDSDDEQTIQAGAKKS